MDASVKGFKTTPEASPADIKFRSSEPSAIVGPASCGKSRLLASVADELPRGTPVLELDTEVKVGRVTPQGMLKHVSPDRIAELLTLTGLWDVRRKNVQSLGPGHQQAVTALQFLSRPNHVVLLDGALDLLSPWVIDGVLSEMFKLQFPLVIATTNRPEIAEKFDRLLVLTERGMRFDGRPHDFTRMVQPDEIEIESDDTSAIRALVEPFQVQLDIDGRTMRFQARDGQELAAKLIREGFPHIRLIAVKQPTLADALKLVLR
ncbi:MAG: hypothetical protein J0L72_06935 [Armatimonadetes bacterium]|nr:hypothetical protein [Armatimonadota bacterium]